MVVAAVSAIVLFFFGFLWWGVAMPVVRPAEVISDETVVDSLSDGLSETSIYFYPDYGDPEAHSEDGPMVIAYFFTDRPAMGQMMGAGFGHMLISALLVSWIVSKVNRPSYWERVRIVALLGVFVAIWADVGNMIWWRHPAMWTVFHFFYDVLSWLVAGLVIAAIIKPDTISEKDATTAD